MHAVSNTAKGFNNSIFNKLIIIIEAVLFNKLRKGRMYAIAESATCILLETPDSGMLVF